MVIKDNCQDDFIFNITQNQLGRIITKSLTYIIKQMQKNYINILTNMKPTYQPNIPKSLNNIVEKISHINSA